MPEQDFLAFGIGAGANVEDQPTWSADPNLVTGFASGLAVSKKFNKAWRQGSVIGRTIGQFISDELVTENVLDNGDLATLLDQYKRALEKLIDSRYKTPIFATTRFYVNAATGSDTTGDGTSAHPFQTIGKACSFIIGTINANGYQLIVSIAAGTYNEGVEINQQPTGLTAPLLFEATGGTVAWNGQVLGVTIGVTGGASISFAGGTWQFGFIGPQPAAAPGVCWFADLGGSISAQATISALNITFASTTGQAHILTQGGASVGIAPGVTVTISGNAAAHISCALGSRVVIETLPITIIGTPVFSQAFIHCFDLGVAYLVGNVYTGAAVGTRYSVSGNAIIQTQGGGASYLPGNAAGSTATGGLYL